MFRKKFSVVAILVVLSMLVPCKAAESAPAASEASADEALAAAAQNPVASMYSLQFEFTFDYGADNGEGTILSIQPVIPITKGDWNYINRIIVLADKHQNILEGLRGLLESLFEGVVMAADQRSLLHALDQMKPQFAIVDLSLLGQGEISTACELNRRFPDVKIIVLSEYDEPGVVDDIMSAGASAFVLKQHVGTDLFDAIESVQKGQIFISPMVKNKRDIRE